MAQSCWWGSRSYYKILFSFPWYNWTMVFIWEDYLAQSLAPSIPLPGPTRLHWAFQQHYFLFEASECMVCPLAHQPLWAIPYIQVSRLCTVNSPSYRWVDGNNWPKAIHTAKTVNKQQKPPRNRRLLHYKRKEQQNNNCSFMLLCVNRFCL